MTNEIDDYSLLFLFPINLKNVNSLLIIIWLTVNIPKYIKTVFLKYNTWSDTEKMSFALSFFTFFLNVHMFYWCL